MSPFSPNTLPMSNKTKILPFNHQAFSGVCDQQISSGHYSFLLLYVQADDGIEHKKSVEKKENGIDHRDFNEMPSFHACFPTMCVQHFHRCGIWHVEKDSHIQKSVTADEWSQVQSREKTESIQGWKVSCWTQESRQTKNYLNGRENNSLPGLHSNEHQFSPKLVASIAELNMKSQERIHLLFIQMEGKKKHIATLEILKTT